MKTIKQVEIEPIFFEECLPGRENMEPNKLYISRKYHGCSHLCFCGCGVECYLPTTPIAGDSNWTLTEHDGKVTISPSIQQRFECKSHYIITKNKANFV
jgi:hypothetical protein